MLHIRRTPRHIPIARLLCTRRLLLLLLLLLLKLKLLQEQQLLLDLFCFQGSHRWPLTGPLVETCL
jgi:hypothetical protein